MYPRVPTSFGRLERQSGPREVSVVELVQLEVAEGCGHVPVAGRETRDEGGAVFSRLLASVPSAPSRSVVFLVEPAGESPFARSTALRSLTA
jgi:hypothetical protein